MSSKTPPTVYRRIIAARLRELRGNRKRPEVEKACNLRDNALYRYESCESSMSDLVAEKVFSYFGVRGKELEDLVNIAKMSRSRTKVTLHSVPSWLEQLLVLERDASVVLEVALTVVPGLLQTERYARAVVSAGSPGYVDEYVAARMERQTILDGKVRLWVVIHEAALRRKVGGAEVMRGQIEHLIEMSRQPNVNIMIIPNAVGAHRGMLTSFKLLEFPVAPNYKLAYTEHLNGAIYVDDPVDVAVFEDAYRHLADAALKSIPSVALLEQIAKDYENDQG